MLVEQVSGSAYLLSLFYNYETSHHMRKNTKSLTPSEPTYKIQEAI